MMTADFTAHFTRRHDLQPFTAPCSDCGTPLTTSIPFARGLLRGLRAPTCSCGNTRTPYCLVAASGSLADALASTP